MARGQEQVTAPTAVGLLVGVLALGLACAVGCPGSARAGDRPNVLLMCLDTVRADHLGCYGYEARDTTPTLDRLAERSTVFDDTSATAGWTKPSVPSILTGTYPIQHGVYRGSSKDEHGVTSDVLPGSAVTLAEAFASHGYATAAFVKNAQLRRGLGFEQGFDVYRDEAGDARQIRWRATDWLEQRDPERPFFLYLHFLDAHWPYAVPDEYATRFADPDEVERFRERDWRQLRDEINSGKAELSSTQLEALLGLYDGSIRYIDDEIGRLMAVLERLELDRNTIVCVVSDHGEEFLEHGRIGHGHGLYETLLAVPWILHVPGRAPRHVPTAASLVDLFPTLLAAAGLGETFPSEGVDRLSRPEAGRPILAEHLEPASYQRSWRRGPAKLNHRHLRGASSTAQAATILDLEPGTRWEARIEVSDAGMRAQRLRPREEGPEEPTEIKGPIDDIGPERLIIDGVELRLSAGTEFYGDGGRGDLSVGRMAKARAERDSANRLVARKVKVYAEDQETEREIRGALRILDATTFELGGIPIRIDGPIELEVPTRTQAIDRDRVVAWLAGPAEIEPGFRTEMELEVLDGLPREVLAGPEGEPTMAELKAFCRDLLERRLWSAQDSASLSDDDVEQLRAIGYAE